MWQFLVVSGRPGDRAAVRFLPVFAYESCWAVALIWKCGGVIVPARVATEQQHTDVMSRSLVARISSLNLHVLVHVSYMNFESLNCP